MAQQMTPNQTAGLAAKQQKLADLEGLLVKFEMAKVEVGGILKTIRDENLFLVAQGRAYPDFVSYCEDRWGVGEREIARRIEAYDQVHALIDAGVDPARAPQNPWQARALQVLINRTDVHTAAAAWQKALTDSQDPRLNPAGRMTGAFLKEQVDEALKAAGRARKAGTPRPRASSTVNVRSHQRGAPGSAGSAGQQAANQAAQANSAPPAQPAPAPAPVTQPSLTPTVTTATDVTAIGDIAADVSQKRLALSNVLQRRTLFANLEVLADAIAAQIGKGAAQSAEGQKLQAALTRLVDAIADKTAVTAAP